MAASGITLVLGGARSGKSEFAERLVTELGSDVTYVATAVVDPDDADHRRRIEEHRARRPPTWSTIEVASELPARLRELTGPALVDSLGTWVTAFPDLDPDPAPLCEALVARDGPSVVVSEEVGLGVHAPTELGRRFADVVGELNQAVAAIAGDVFLVVAGRALHLDA